jgi:Putative polyhydroxyalkanoic acid system protein (PHA_gran_rgn)
VGSKTLEQRYPGKSAAEIYGKLEKVLRAVSKKYGVTCEFDQDRQTIAVPERMGISGLCTATDGEARVVMKYGLLGGALAGPVEDYIEREMKKLFA